MRTQYDVLEDLKKVQEELAHTSHMSQNFGHLMTIIAGLYKELQEVKDAETKDYPTRLPMFWKLTFRKMRKRFIVWLISRFWSSHWKITRF